MKDNILVSINQMKRELVEKKIEIACAQLFAAEMETYKVQMKDLQQANYKEAEKMETFFADEKLLRTIQKKEKAKVAAKKAQYWIPKIFNIAASAALVIFILFSTAFAASPVFRMEIAKLIYRITPEYTEISYESHKIPLYLVPEGWQEEYYMSYIPPGYELVGVDGTSNTQGAVYTKSDNEYLFFDVNSMSVEANVDTEDFTSFKEVIINGQEGLLAYKDKETTVIVWTNQEKYFYLSINEDKEVALQVAKSVIKIK